MCFKKVSGVCCVHFKSVLRKLLGFVRSALRVFESSCKLVLKQFQECFRRVSRKFLGVLWKFQECFKSDSKKFHVSRVLQRGFKFLSLDTASG